MLTVKLSFFIMADMDLAMNHTHEYAVKAANTSRMHTDPSITVKQLMEWISRFMVRRGSRDLFRLPDCFDKLKECDPPTKYAEDLVALHDLFIDGLDVVKNGVLPMKKMDSALLLRGNYMTAVHQDTVPGCLVNIPDLGGKQVVSAAAVDRIRTSVWSEQGRRWEMPAFDAGKQKAGSLPRVHRDMQVLRPTSPMQTLLS